MVGDLHDDFLPSDRPARRDIDVAQLGRHLKDRKWWLIGPTLACLVLSAIVVNTVSPRYTAETKILLENQESYFTRGDKLDPQPAPLPDDEAVQSQVQLVTSRDLARSAIRQLNLQGNPEYDPLAKGVGPITRTLVLLGLEQDPTRVAPEDRMLDAYFDRLTVFPVTKSRVLTIEFDSKDPDLAARAANTVANLYIDLQGSVKRDSARSAAETLRSLIAGLRIKAADAEAQAQAFRTQAGLVLGTNNTTISSQQLADMSTQLAQARSTQADAQAKAKLIRDMIKAGRATEVPDVVNNDLIRRLSEQRANIQAEIALQSRTLLPGHPRMQELKAQLGDLDRQLRIAADKAARALDNDASVSASRVDNLASAMNQQKDVIGAAGGDQVKLNELDLNARLLKDQLELNTTKFQDALARENAVSTPADARVISRAIAPSLPSFPKKLPIIVLATLAGALISLGIVIARELLSGRSVVSDAQAQHVPIDVRTTPVEAEFAEAPAAVKAESPVEDGSLIAARVRPETDVAPVAKSITSLTDPFLSAFDTMLTAKKPDEALRIMVACSDGSQAPTHLAMRIGRALSRSFRTIVVDCFAGPDATPASSVQVAAGFPEPYSSGFVDLLEGRSSFAEVIHRDSTSRLHFVSGVLDEDLRTQDQDGVANLLDALAETYDYVIVSGPVLRDAAPAVLAEYIDMIVMEAPTEQASSELERIKRLFGTPAQGAPGVVIVEPEPGIETGMQGSVAA